MRCAPRFFHKLMSSRFLSGFVERMRNFFGRVESVVLANSQNAHEKLTRIPRRKKTSRRQFRGCEIRRKWKKADISFANGNIIARPVLFSIFKIKRQKEGKERSPSRSPLAPHLRARIPARRLSNASLSIPRISCDGRHVPAHAALHAREEDASVQKHSHVRENRSPPSPAGQSRGRGRGRYLRTHGDATHVRPPRRF